MFKKLKPKKIKIKENNINNKSVISSRLNILLGIAAVLLFALVIRLSILTIVSGNKYSALINQTNKTTESTVKPRGSIYDSRGKLLVGNTFMPSVSFLRPLNMSNYKIHRTANKLSNYLFLDTSSLTSRQQIDYYLANKKNNRSVSKKAHSSSYKKEVNYLKTNHFSLPQQDKNKAAIYTKMAGTSTLSNGIIKTNNVSEGEVSAIAARLKEFPGIRIDQGWKRDFPQGKDFNSLLGSLSSTGTGLPSTGLSNYLHEGYSRDATVGTSGIEKQYENILRGINKKTSYTTNSNNKIVGKKVIQPGQTGNNLRLTINSKFEKDTSNDVKKYIQGGLSTGGYAVAMNYNTGAIYSISGWDRDNKTGKLTRNDLAPIQDPMIMGSAIKPAMVANGFQHGAITPENSEQNDQKINFAGSSSITSDFNPTGRSIPLNVDSALENSSNTYMVQLALKINGTPYYSGMNLSENPGIWDKMRNGFAQFGLGRKTGVDLPDETAGNQGSITGSHKTSWVYDAFGQYDTYSLIQMARYVSVFANGGYLVKPRIVNSILGSTGNGNKPKMVNSNNPVVQGRVNLTNGGWQAIKKGMYDVANGSSATNTGGPTMHKLDPKVYAKTGTAQGFENGTATQNDTLVMYSPRSDAPIALAIGYINDKVGSYGNVEKGAADIYNDYWKDVKAK